MGVIGSAALLVALGIWTYRAVESSLQEIRGVAMRDLLESEVNALRVWVREEIGDAERIARDARVRDAIAALTRVAARHRDSDPELCAGAARGELEAVIRPLLRDSSEWTFNVVEPGGRLLATRFPEYCGLHVNSELFLPLLKPVFEGASRFVRPFRDAERVTAPARLRPGPAFARLPRARRSPSTSTARSSRADASARSLPRVRRSPTRRARA